MKDQDEGREEHYLVVVFVDVIVDVVVAVVLAVVVAVVVAIVVNDAVVVTIAVAGIVYFDCLHHDHHVFSKRQQFLPLF